MDGHALWVSQAALEIAERALPGGRWPGPGEVEGGEVVRDDKGQPTGEWWTSGSCSVNRANTSINNLSRSLAYCEL